jgi:hypothetical protein
MRAESDIGPYRDARLRERTGGGVNVSGAITRLLEDDHRRLASLLERAFASPVTVDAAAYAEFRRGLLRHIGMEEKILLPAAQHARGGEPHPSAARLRLDHGALAALLVPSPSAAIGKAIRTILERHNAVEEGRGGTYEDCERLAGPETEALLAALGGTPSVPVSPHNDSPVVFEALRRAVARAGYDPVALGL